MKLAALVSVFPKEDKHKIYNFVRNKARISLRTLSRYCACCVQHLCNTATSHPGLSNVCPNVPGLYCPSIVDYVMRHSDTCNILDYNLTHDPYSTCNCVNLHVQYLPDWFECFGFALCPSRFVQCLSRYVSVTTVHPLFTWNDIFRKDS